MLSSLLYVVQKNYLRELQEFKGIRCMWDHQTGLQIIFLFLKRPQKLRKSERLIEVITILRRYPRDMQINSGAAVSILSCMGCNGGCRRRYGLCYVLLDIERGRDDA